MQAKFNSFAMGMAAAAVDFIVTCTRRTQAEQEALFAQGRDKPGKIVTWTLKSKHIDGTAFDIVIMVNGKPDWNVTNPDWNLAGEIGEQAGLEWGGRWHKSPDFPHFQLREVA